MRRENGIYVFCQSANTAVFQTPLLRTYVSRLNIAGFEGYDFFYELRPLIRNSYIIQNNFLLRRRNVNWRGSRYCRVGIVMIQTLRFGDISRNFELRILGRLIFQTSPFVFINASGKKMVSIGKFRTVFFQECVTDAAHIIFNKLRGIIIIRHTNPRGKYFIQIIIYLFCYPLIGF